MCGRYTVRKGSREAVERLGLQVLDAEEERFNVAPGQSVQAVRTTAQGLESCALRWGFVPSWAEDSSVGFRLINARSETAATKPSFREAWQERRCLLPADGFFEWKRQGRLRQPYHIHYPDHRAFWLAGLWECWSAGEQLLESCTVLTVEANAEVNRVHDRMPAILGDEAARAWLAAPESSLLASLPAGSLELTPVSDYVNKAGNEGSRCLERVAEAPKQEELF